MRLSRLLASAAVAALGVTAIASSSARAADPASCATVRMGTPGWSDIQSTNGIADTTLWPIASRRRMVSGDKPRSMRNSSGQS